jgi:hypothetical protein
MTDIFCNNVQSATTSRNGGLWKAPKRGRIKTSSGFFGQDEHDFQDLFWKDIFSKIYVEAH